MVMKGRDGFRTAFSDKQSDTFRAYCSAIACCKRACRDRGRRLRLTSRNCSFPERLHSSTIYTVRTQTAIRCSRSSQGERVSSLSAKDYRSTALLVILAQIQSPRYCITILYRFLEARTASPPELRLVVVIMQLRRKQHLAPFRCSSST